MAKEHVTNEALQIHFDYMKEGMEKIIKNGEETLEQVKYTNGRVTALEYWRKYIIIGGTILTTGIITMYPLVKGWIKANNERNAILQQIQIEKQIKEAVSLALDGKEILISN